MAHREGRWLSFTYYVACDPVRYRRNWRLGFSLTCFGLVGCVGPLIVGIRYVGRKPDV